MSEPEGMTAAEHIERVREGIWREDNAAVRRELAGASLVALTEKIEELERERDSARENPLIRRWKEYLHRAEAAEQRAEELERERDIAREAVDDFTEEYVALESQLAERNKRIEELELRQRQDAREYDEALAQLAERDKRIEELEAGSTPGSGSPTSP